MELECISPVTFSLLDTIYWDAYLECMAKATKRQASKAPARRGRPPKDDEWAMKQIAIRFPLPMIVEIDELRAARMDKPERAAMIRELVAKGIDAAKTGR